MTIFSKKFILFVHRKFTKKFSRKYWQVLKMDIIYIGISNQTQRVLKEVIKLLDQRKKKVLQAIVEEYVNTAEPISSNQLKRKRRIKLQ